MRNSARQFEDILDRCIVAMQTRGQTVEECLAQYPAKRAELEPLLLLCARLQRAHSLTAPVAFRQSAAVRMQNLVAASAPPARRPAPRSPAREWLAALWGSPRLVRAAAWVSGLLVVLLILSTGAVVASAKALPGEPLYPIKTAVEQWQLALTPSEAAVTRLHIAYASRRLQEATALIEAQQVGPAAHALAGYADQIEQALALLETETRLSPEVRQALAHQLSSALQAYQAQLAALQALSAAKPPATLDRALLVSQAGQRRSMLLLESEQEEPQGAGGRTPTAPEQPTGFVPSATPTLTRPTSTPTDLSGSATDTPTPSPTPTFREPLPQPTATQPALLPPRPPQPTTLPTALPPHRPAPERTALPTPRPPRPTDLPTAQPTERPTRAVPLPTRPLRPPDLPTVRPPLRPTDAPTTQPTAWPTWPAQTETPWPTPTTPAPSDPTITPTTPPGFAPPRPIVPPGLRETATALPRPHRTPAP